MKFDRSSTMYATILLTATGLAGQILGFFYRIALSRLIGAETMGLYQLVMPVYSVILSIISVGLTTAVSTLAARYYALGQRSAVRQTLRRSLGIFFTLALPLSVLIVLCSDFISVSLLGDARTRLGLVLVAFCVILTGTENVHKHLFYGIGQVRAPALIELCEQIIRITAVLALLLLFLPQYPERVVGLIVAGMIISEIFSVSSLLLLSRRRLGGRIAPAGPPVSRAAIGRIALPVGFTALLGNLMGSATSVMIPQRLVAGGMAVSEAMSAFGVLSGMTIPLLSLPSALIGAMCLILVPKLSESSALNDKGAIRRRLGRALQSTSVLMMPATALLIVVGPSLGQLLFKDSRVGHHILPLAVGLLLCCYQSVLACALNGVGRQGAAARNALIADVIQVAFTWYTVALPGVGLKGYVAGFVVSAVVGLGLNALSVLRSTGLKIRWFPWLLSPGLAALLTGLCINLLFRVTRNAGAPLPAAIGLCALFGAIEYLAALQAQGVRVRQLFRLR